VGKLIIFGNTSFAEIAAEYFSSAGFEVIAHLVDPQYLSDGLLNGRIVVGTDSERAIKMRSEASHFFVASTYTQLNRFRANKFREFKDIGLIPASFISPHAFVDPSVKLGEHVFIFENNVIQFGTEIGNNCILWSGNHIGHHSIIEDNVFVSSHVVVSGHCTIGANSFLGVNSTIYNNVEIGRDNWIGPSSVVAKSTQENTMMRAELTKASHVPTRQFFRLHD
jgi:sugar O-acyltransferase (sialic acid O-acetyltransferase NeuD family)